MLLSRVFIMHHFHHSRTSLVRQLTEDGTQHLPAHLPKKFHSSDISSNVRPKLKKAATILDLEDASLRPRLQGRIQILTPEVREVFICV